MSLFNFDNDSFNNKNFNQEQTGHEVECQCDECSIEHTLEIVDYFTERVLTAKSREELHEILYHFAETAKFQGVREYLFESIDIKTDTLLGLDNFMKIFNKNKNSKKHDSSLDFNIDIDFNSDTDYYYESDYSYLDDDFDDFGDVEPKHWKDRL